jgi:hypothetical protein
LTAAGQAAVSTAQSFPEPSDAQLEFFEKKVRPIFANHCYGCHAADTKAAGGLRVDDRNGIYEGGDAGPGIVPGDPGKSFVLKRVLHEDPKRRMPRDSDPLSASEIADLTAWVKDGAPWPREKIPSSLGRVKVEYAQLRTNHWAWQPLTHPKVPAVASTKWPRTDIDRFVVVGWEKKQLRPVADADALTLVRRVTFDLTGLPPTPAEIDAFQKDSSPQAFEHLVDRLLASPGFGERWGRSWLDVARYGESTGPSRNIPYPHAWKYRDYVIDAVNRDVPFDRFIQEQIAGDLLPAKSNEERHRLQTATGFLALGVKDVNQRFKVRFVMDNVAEQVDTVTRSVLGLTVGCARCHDHKFEPIPITDYYALAGIFTSTDDCAGVRNKMGGGGLDYYDPKKLVVLEGNIPEAPKDQVAKLETEVAEAKKAWDAIRGTPEGLKPAADGRPTQRPFRLKYEKAQGELLALTDPASRGFAVHGVRDAQKVGDTEVRIRGEAERLGPTAPRGFLTAFSVPEVPAINPNQSGRLELAQWMTSPHNPLTPRVIVNRVWAHLFSQGIVTTVDNFGVKGDVPSHPELLDYLASNFIDQGWSIKKLVRNIVLSRTYQLGSEATEAQRAVDPANRLVWRHSPRRLEAEEVRDAILAASGKLQPAPPKGSPAMALKMIEMRDNGAEARTIREQANSALYRSIYLPLLRGVTPGTLEPFDPVEQGLVTGQRESTTVPTQSLYLLNSAFVLKQSLALSERVLAEPGLSDAQRIQRAYLLALDRPAKKQEVSRALKYLADFIRTYPVNDAPAPVTLASVATDRTRDGDGDKAAAVNPDDIDRTDLIPVEDKPAFWDARVAAWSNFTQALFASAEFRFVR